MRLRRPGRTPLVLLAGTVLTLLFPRACDSARIAVASLLPATVPQRDPAPVLPEEERLRLVARIEELERERAALPPSEGAVRILRVERPQRVEAAVVAPVLHRDVSRTRRSFVIGAGSASGVARGHAVIHGESLVGVVDSVAAHSARVLRIDDRAAETAMPVSVLDPKASEGAANRGVGVARGSGDGRVHVGFLPPGSARPGDWIVSAPGGGLVGPGWLLGVVTSAGDDDRDGDFEALASPLHDLDEVATVVVLVAEPVRGVNR